MRRTGTPAQPKFDYQLAWLKRLAALKGLYASGAPVVLALWRMFFGKACYERGWRARGSQTKCENARRHEIWSLPECAECHTTVMGQNQDEKEPI